MKEENGKVNQPKKVDQPKKGKNETLRQSVMFTLLSLRFGGNRLFCCIRLDQYALLLGTWTFGNSERFVELHTQQKVHL